jgi:acyl-CoA dehydrogenase
MTMGTPEEVATDSRDQADIRQLARSLVENFAGPDRIRELDEAERFDEELYTALAQAGLIGLGADASVGRDADPEHQIVVLEELAAGPTSMAVCLVVQYMGVRLLCSFGTGEQRRSLLTPLVDGCERIAFALSEAGGGTDIARAMCTRARRTEQGWILNGTKTWISGAASARHAIVLARTGPAEPSAIDGISAFVVPFDSRGLMVRRLGTVAIHGLDTCEITFDDVGLDAQALLGEPGSGFRHVIATLNGERLNAAAAALGIARGALTAATNYARGRTAFGRPIGAFQALQHALADGAIKVEAARGLIRPGGRSRAGQ